MSENISPLPLASTPQVTVVQNNPVQATSTIAKIITVIILLLFTVGLSILWYGQFSTVSVISEKVYSSNFTLPGDMSLKAGPSLFRYDDKLKELQYRGRIDDSIKEELLKLLIGTGKSFILADRQYTSAINDLAYKSQDEPHVLLHALFWLAGLTAALGVQLRSMADFIGIACYKGNGKGELDLARWWPWYVLRPLMGCLVGVAVIFLVQEGVLQLGSPQAKGMHWWISIAFVAGFGTQDITGRLRQVSRALFGGAENG